MELTDTTTQIENDPSILATRAAVLLERAMADSYSSVSQLGDALDRIAHVLAAAPPAGDPSASSIHREKLLRDIRMCIQSVQYHDRLIQQLTHVREILSGRSPSPARWQESHGAEGTVELF